MFSITFLDESACFSIPYSVFNTKKLDFNVRILREERENLEDGSGLKYTNVLLFELVCSSYIHLHNFTLHCI